MPSAQNVLLVRSHDLHYGRPSTKKCDVGFSTKFSCGKYIANKYTFSSLGGYLVAMSCACFSNMIWAHSPYTKSWIYVGGTSLWHNTVLVSRGSELVLFGEDTVKMTLHGEVP